MILIFKYKKKIYYVFLSDFCKAPGIKFNHNGLTIISLNKNLPKWKRQLELHRLIKGRRLKDIKTRKVTKNF